MKPSESTLNILLKTALLAACFCFFSEQAIANTRFAYVTVKQTEHTTFPSAWNGHRDTSWHNPWYENGSLPANYTQFFPYDIAWLAENHNFPSTDFSLQAGESLKILGVTVYNTVIGPNTFREETDTAHTTSGELAFLSITRPHTDYEATIRAYRLFIATGNLTEGTNFKNSNSNSNYQIFESFFGPCTITFFFRPTCYRQFGSARDHNGNNRTLSEYSSKIGYGGWEYTPSEMHVALEISGTPTDTSVGSTVGGGTSGSTSGKNYVTVIPENSPTDVRIVLEQSTDLINWTSANQGVFSPSTSRRFFRVRAEEE